MSILGGGGGGYGGGGGGYGGGGGDRGGGDMVTQEDTVFIQGMNPVTTEEELCQYFGSIGIIKVLGLSLYLYAKLFLAFLLRVTAP